MKPIIRAITGFISVKDFSSMQQLLDDCFSIKQGFLEAGYEVQTIRITTDILESLTTLEELAEYKTLIEDLEKHESVSLFHLGSLTQQLLRQTDTLAPLLHVFLNSKKLFMGLDAGSGSDHTAYLCDTAARICRSIAQHSPFECRRFGVYANIHESTPFYPASRVFSNSMSFAIASQCANLAVEEAGTSHADGTVFEQRLKKRLENEFLAMDAALPESSRGRFLGFDTSLAPFPSDEWSIAYAIERVLGKAFGSSGTLTLARVLTRVMQENRIKKTGLCGLMLPVVEDNVLAKRGIEGKYTLRDLLLFSSVCATGLDAIPISGAISERSLSNCYHDLVTLAVTLEKPLSARFFMEPDKKEGDTVKYEWSFACESPVFKV
jgi:uncharacterized protein (UPF0210 family)